MYKKFNELSKTNIGELDCLPDIRARLTFQQNRS